MVQQYTMATARTADYSNFTEHNMDLHAHSSVCKHATLKKVKTNKHKFFVLHKDSSSAPARLEYYDTESQWIKKKKAKRTIYLRTCFSINAFSDTKAKFGMTIFTKDDSFQMGFDSEQDRDMWLADMRLLSHSSHQSCSVVQHLWNVRAHTRNMKCPFEGEFKLCLSEHQATLISKINPDQILDLPLMVITHCIHKDKYFGFELRENAETGAGEIWAELEDSLIAQHVYRAFMQNLSLISPGENAFRPVSRSLSHKDRKSANSMRLRSGSDARQRTRIGQSMCTKMGQYSSVMVMSPSGRTHSSMGLGRERSDSIDSYSTTASLSTDDSEFSRSVTPDTRMESPAYMPMNCGKKTSDDNCNCSSLSNGSLSSSDYTAMTNHHHHKASHEDKNSNFMYVDMSGNHHHPYTDMSRKDSGYIDMTVANAAAKYSGYKMKPEPVRCYLIEDETSQSPDLLRTESHIRSQATPSPQNCDYVEMRRRRGPVLSEKDKSSSAPHLLPLTPYQQQDQFMNMEFEAVGRDRTSSMTCAHRPRGSSWSQFVRPRSSTTDHRLRGARSHRAYTNSKQIGTDYIDMTCSKPTTDSYVDMCLSQKAAHKLSHALSHSTQQRTDDKENHYQPPSPRSTTRVQLVDPFPELSASSEDDISLHSMEGSISLHSLTSNSLTSSADSMSMSSHSSHYGGGTLTTSLDAEPYVAMQPAPHSYVQSTAHRMMPKPAKISSYILDDSLEQKSSDYMDMVPSGKPSKQ